MHEILQSRIKQNGTAYEAFHPLIELKGHLSKMHRSKLTKYLRFIYLNPVEGVLISFKAAHKFPHQPHNIIHLNSVTKIELMRKSKWYFSRGFHYMRVVTPEKTQIFFDDNLDVVSFWVNQIYVARKFYLWLQDLIRIRYKFKSQDCVNQCEAADSMQLADSLIETAIQLKIPQVQMDKYSTRLKISANDYAVKKASKFMAKTK